MIEETATVTASEGGFAQVETQRETACGGCSAKSACGTSALAKLFANRRASVRVLNPIGARPGEQVIVGLDESALTRVSFVFYIIPLLSLFLFAAGGEWLSGYLGFAATELSAIFGGLLGLSLGPPGCHSALRGSLRDAFSRRLMGRTLQPANIRSET